MTTPTSTLQTTEGPRSRSTEPPADTGQIVLVLLEPRVSRPLLVTRVERTEVGVRNTPTTAPVVTTMEWRVSGLLVCEPEDFKTAALHGDFQRSGDPARITGQPSRQFPFAYAESLAEGDGIGQWRRRP